MSEKQQTTWNTHYG